MKNSLLLLQAFQIANLMREYIEVLNAAAEELTKQLQLTNGGVYPPPINTAVVPILPAHPNQIKYPQKGGMQQFRNPQNSTLVAPQPS